MNEAFVEDVFVLECISSRKEWQRKFVILEERVPV